MRLEDIINQPKPDFDEEVIGLFRPKSFKFAFTMIDGERWATYKSVPVAKMLNDTSFEAVNGKVYKFKTKEALIYWTGQHWKELLGS